MWPPLPLIIRDYGKRCADERTAVDNLIAALEHSDRVREINLDWYPCPGRGYVTDSAAMQKPFPELTYLILAMNEDESRPILPDSFLGGTAPRLQSLVLQDVPFPGLPKLILSATHLVNLELYCIPCSGYIPPEAMATSFSALTSLETLRLFFRCPPPRPALGSRRPPPLTRSILPNLTYIGFSGTSEYLEEILARIDAPRLDDLNIAFFNQIIFDTTQLFQFARRTPTLRAPERGIITFMPHAIVIKFHGLSVKILCTTSEWQLSSLEQVCALSLPLVSTLEDLYIEEKYSPPPWHDDVEITLWLDVLRPFVAVKNLYISEEFVPRIAPALEELVGGRTTEVLPTLDNIFSKTFQQSRPIHEGVEKFIAARRLTSHPVAVSPRGLGRVLL